MPDDSKERVNVYLDPEVKARIKKESEKMGIPMSGFINVCIAEYLHQHDAMDVLKIADKLNEIIAKNGGAPEQDAARG